MTTAGAYRTRVGKEWKALIGDLPPVMRNALDRRLTEFVKCGRAVQVRSCKGCGEDRLGSGTFHGTRTCKTKACPSCASIRAAQYEEWAEQAYEKVPHVEGYSWRWFVLTTKYDPTDGETDLSVEGLRTRAAACGRAAREVWTKLLKKHPGSGALRTVEVGARGHVHLNFVYYGPKLDRGEVERTAKKVAPYFGHAYLADVNKDGSIWKKKNRKAHRESGCETESKKIKSGLKKLAKYISKGLAHETDQERIRDEDFVTGQAGAGTVDPELAARWEIATYRMQLSQRFGVCRGIEMDEHAEKSGPDNTKDDEVVCSCCGMVGWWESRYRRTSSWFEKCHEAGTKALHSTNAKWRSVTWPEGPD